MKYRVLTRNVISKGRDQVTNLLVEKDFLKKAVNIIENDPDQQWCLISIDIEHFRFFDEWYGREAGDNLLSKVGALLAEAEKDFKGITGYFGKDDFAIVMPYDENKIQKLFDDIKEIIFSFGATAGFMPAFGIAMIEKGLALVDAFDRSTIASAKAKSDIRNRICIYNSEMQFLVQKESRLLSEFMQALKNREITFYLQPQCRISSKKVVGVEALARWIDPEHGFLNPGIFIPSLEDAQLAYKLDLAMLEIVCKNMRRVLDSGETVVPTSINFSRSDFSIVDIPNEIVRITKKYNIPTHYLHIEITESALLEKTVDLAEAMRRIKENGFSIWLDDFGSGYSSFNTLKDYEFDVLKLDMEFLKGFETNKKSKPLIKAVIDLAGHNLYYHH